MRLIVVAIYLNCMAVWHRRLPARLRLRRRRPMECNQRTDAVVCGGRIIIGCRVEPESASAVPPKTSGKFRTSGACW